MNNFAEHITPEQAMVINPERGYTLSRWRKLARGDNMCQCGQEKVWKFGETGLCFSCTTGEADASDDYELIDGGAK